MKRSFKEKKNERRKQIVDEFLADIRTTVCNRIDTETDDTLPIELIISAIETIARKEAAKFAKTLECDGVIPFPIRKK